MKREELLKNPEYYVAECQINLFKQVKEFLEKNNIPESELYKHLRCSKRIAEEILSGDFDQKLSKFFEICLSIGKVPVIEFRDINEVLKSERL